MFGRVTSHERQKDINYLWSNTTNIKRKLTISKQTKIDEVIYHWYHRKIILIKDEKDYLISELGAIITEQ